MRITIYGASDDLIEVEGDLVEEFSAAEGGPHYLAFGDGTVLSVEYGKDGCWRINRRHAGLATFEKHDVIDADGVDYSDQVILTGPLPWVVVGRQLEKIGAS